jgi:hypothetical protein
VGWTLLAPPFSGLNLNAGTAASYIDTLGNTYVGELFVSGGQAGRVQNVSVAGTVEDELLRTFRRGPQFTYTIPMANGTYTVTLLFMDPWSTAAGSRVFSVTANGSTVVSNLDIYRRVGQLAYLAVPVPITVSTGQLALGFKGSTGSAIVSAFGIK